MLTSKIWSSCKSVDGLATDASGRSAVCVVGFHHIAHKLPITYRVYINRLVKWLTRRDLSGNNLTRLESDALSGLAQLEELCVQWARAGRARVQSRCVGFFRR